MASDKIEFVKRDGKTYTGKDMERILAREKDEETVSSLESEVGIGGKLKAYGSDAADALRGIVKMDTSGGSRAARDKYDQNKESYERAKSRLKENNYRKGGKVKASASSRGDGIAQRGKTRGRMV